MLPRRSLMTLVFALPILAISFGALLGAAELMAALGDIAGGRVMRWMAIFAVLVLFVDALCLLIVLGLSALGDRDE